MINFGGLPQRSGDWTWFKTLQARKGFRVQYEEDAAAYQIYGYDGPEVLLCTIWKSTVPPSVVAGGYSQAQNDTDKTDFETDFEPNANRAIAFRPQLVTYSVEVPQAGANNRDMISILNPSGSGKIVKIREAWATVPSSSGTTVIIPFEIRHATAITTGTTQTPKPMDSADPASVAEVRVLPTGISDASAPIVWWTWTQQINTSQGSTDAMTHTIHDGMVTSELKPITLRPGHGLYLRQIANNTSTFRVGFFWTEEDE
jgi:hypothetical protein